MIKLWPIIALITTQTFATDLVHCTGNCQTSCSDNEKISLAVLDSTSQDLLRKFELKTNSSESHKNFIDDISAKMANLSTNKKSISEACLDKYCEQPGKKNMRFDLSHGLALSYTNPICDYSIANRNPPMNLLMVFLESENGSLTQMTFNKNENAFNMMIKTPSQKCSDNEGGTFNNSFVISLNALAVVPNDGTTQVKNTPVGAQLIRKKKFVPRMVIEDSGEILFNLGDGYEATVDPKTNTMKSNNLLLSPCKGSIIRNPAKGTSRLGVSMNSLNAKGSKVYDTNNYKLIEAEAGKVPW